MAKNKIINVLEMKKGEIFHVDDTYQIMQNGTHDLWMNVDDHDHNKEHYTSDTLKALRGFKITVTIETNR